MREARQRYASVYRFRGTPVPAIALAQVLASMNMLAGSRRTSARYSSPLIVYSSNTVQLVTAIPLVTGPQGLGPMKAIIFPR